jgi:hypothetical protein
MLNQEKQIETGRTGIVFQSRADNSKDLYEKVHILVVPKAMRTMHAVGLRMHVLQMSVHIPVCCYEQIARFCTRTPRGPRKKTKGR